jgi:hypothetical protein
MTDAELLATLQPPTGMISHGSVQPGQVLPLPGTGLTDEELLQSLGGGTDWRRTVGEASGAVIGAARGAPAGPVGMILGGALGAVMGSEASQSQAPIEDRSANIPGIKTPWGTEIKPTLPQYQPQGPQPTMDERTMGERAQDIGESFRGGAASGTLGFLARGPLAYLERGVKSLARGMRSIPEAELVAKAYRAEQAAMGVTDARGPVATFAAELAKMGGPGASAEILSGGMTGGGAAIVSTVLRLPAATKTVLANSPGFARWALSTAPSAGVDAAAAVAGQAAEQIGDAAGFTAEQFDSLIEVMAEEGPEVASAVRDFIREMAMQERNQ